MRRQSASATAATCSHPDVYAKTTPLHVIPADRPVARWHSRHLRHRDQRRRAQAPRPHTPGAVAELVDRRPLPPQRGAGLEGRAVGPEGWLAGAHRPLRGGHLHSRAAPEEPVSVPIIGCSWVSNYS
jgi:hypothetical protein